MAEPSMPNEAQGQEATKRCPFCAETILAAAIKCKHCGERLDQAQSPVIDARPASTHSPIPAAPPAATPGAAMLGSHSKSYLLAALLMLVPAAVCGSFLEGMFKWADNRRYARQLGIPGVDGSLVGQMRSELGDEGCTTSGTVLFWGLWLGGTGLTGRWFQSRRLRGHAKAGSIGGSSDGNLFNEFRK